MKAKLAFYKGPGDITDKAIRWWTNSRFSHVELVVGSQWISTSPRTMVLSSRRVTPDTSNWEYLDINIDEHLLEDLKVKYMGHKYDWLGIVMSQFVPAGVEDPNRLFCSEWCAKVLGYKNANEYSPGDLYRKLTA